jgi:hypothetical protein
MFQERLFQVMSIELLCSRQAGLEMRQGRRGVLHLSGSRRRWRRRRGFISRDQVDKTLHGEIGNMANTVPGATGFMEQQQTFDVSVGIEAAIGRCAPRRHRTVAFFPDPNNMRTQP